MRLTAFDLDAFHRWAMGNLVDNRNRGIFAECMVGQALGLATGDPPRVEWDAVDLHHYLEKHPIWV